MSYLSEVQGEASLVAHWRLGETSGTAADDLESATNGTYVGGYTLNQPGAVDDSDKAVALNGTTGYINTNRSLSIATTGKLTVEFWIKFTALGGSQTAIFHGNSQYDFGMTFLGGGELQCSIWNTGGGSRASATFGPVTPSNGVWYHIVVTFDDVSDFIDCYVNGVLDEHYTGAWSGTSGVISDAIQIGRRHDTNSNFCNATIDEVAIYNDTLSAARIAAHYAAASGGTKVGSDSATGTDTVTEVGTGAATAKTGSDTGAGVESRTTTDTSFSETGSGVDLRTVSGTVAKLGFDSAVGFEVYATPGLPTSVVLPILQVFLDEAGDGSFSGDEIPRADLHSDSKVSWSRGRSSDFSNDTKGDAYFTLKNETGSYSPETNPNLRPGKPVLIKSTLASVEHAHFYGFIQRVVPNANARTVKVVCYDPFQRMDEIDVVVAANPFVQRSCRDMRIAVLEDYERGVRNLIANPSFEVDISGWSTENGFGGTLTRVDDDSAPGAGSACAEFFTTQELGTISTRTRMAPVYFQGQIYRFSISLRTLSGTADVYIGMLTNRIGMPSNPAIAPKQVTIDSTWRRYSVTFTIPTTFTASSSASFDPVPLTAYVSTTGPLTFRLDGAAVTRGQALYPYTEVDSGRWPNWVGNGSFDGGGLNGWYDGWANLVPNPSFEVNTTGWAADGGGAFDTAGATLTRSTSDPLYGVGRANVTCSTGGGIYTNLTGTFKAGQQYAFSVRFKLPGGNTLFHRLWLGSAGTPADAVQASLPAQSMGGQWHTLSEVWTPTADRTDVQLAYVASSITTNLQLDGFSVIRLDSAQVVAPSYYADTGPGGGGSFVTSRGLSTVARWGSLSHSIDTPATAGAGRVYDFNLTGPYFVGGLPYTASVWVQPSSAMPYKVGLGASRGDGTFDEASTTGTAPANEWTQIIVTWTPSADRASAAHMDVVLFIYQTDATAREFLVDGVRAIPGSAADAFEMPHWQLGPEPDIYSTSASLSGVALQCLAQLNRMSLSRHYIRPKLTAPFYDYVTSTRQELPLKEVTHVFNNDFRVTSFADLDLDRASIINVVAVNWAFGSTIESDEDSVLEYEPRPGPSIGTSLANGATAVEIGQALLARYKDPRARPSMTVKNKFPTMLVRELDDLIQVTLTLLNITDKRYLIVHARTEVGSSGVEWETAWRLEEHAY